MLGRWGTIQPYLWIRGLFNVTDGNFCFSPLCASPIGVYSESYDPALAHCNVTVWNPLGNGLSYEEYDFPMFSLKDDNNTQAIKQVICFPLDVGEYKIVQSHDKLLTHYESKSELASPVVEVRNNALKLFQQQTRSSSCRSHSIALV